VKGKTQLNAILDAVERLPSDWHGAGSLRTKVLRKLVDYAGALNVQHSLETGTGKSTLLFSHLSSHHTVFAKDDTGDGNSLQAVQESSILYKQAVQFVVGPTQITLPSHIFTHKLQLAFIDGPHGYPFPDLEYYLVYPHLDVGALLIVDDINIPTVFKLFEFLREDQMFELLEVIHTTAFFKRTAAPVFNPLGDGWWSQEYNRKRFPVRASAVGYSMTDRVKAFMPRRVKSFLKRAVGRK
jgi:hypothetical protein